MNLFRKVFLAGLGAASVTQKQGKKILADLVKEGKLHEAEAEALIDSWMEKAKGFTKETKSSLKDQGQEWKDNLKKLSLTQIKQMQQALQDLEKKLKTQAEKGQSSKKKSK
jgi:poly(hydroxyalkanoate) granule-associated protein